MKIKLITSIVLLWNKRNSNSAHKDRSIDIEISMLDSPDLDEELTPEAKSKKPLAKAPLLQQFSHQPCNIKPTKPTMSEKSVNLLPVKAKGVSNNDALFEDELRQIDELNKHIAKLR